MDNIALKISAERKNLPHRCNYYPFIKIPSEKRKVKWEHSLIKAGCYWKLQDCFSWSNFINWYQNLKKKSSIYKYFSHDYMQIRKFVKIVTIKHDPNTDLL